MATLQRSSDSIKYHPVTDTAAWADDYPYCDGNSQSPINIDSMGNTMEDFSNFTFSVGYKTILSLSLRIDTFDFS